jgi:hypothetical protein
MRRIVLRILKPVSYVTVIKLSEKKAKTYGYGFFTNRDEKNNAKKDIKTIKRIIKKGDSGG